MMWPTIYGDSPELAATYFVLGNHDFYRGSIASVRYMVQALPGSAEPPLDAHRTGVIPLSESTCLVGHDGWGDGRLGDYYGSDVMLNDFRLIGGFDGIGESKRSRLAKIHALGGEAAAHLRNVLPDALVRFQHVIVLTHVPPFRESCWHEGKISDDNWLPFFTCKAFGDVLREAMAAAPDRKMTVLCGHTHGTGEVDILPNLRVLTGGAVYGKPDVQRSFERCSMTSYERLTTTSSRSNLRLARNQPETPCRGRAERRTTLPPSRPPSLKSLEKSPIARDSRQPGRKGRDRDQTSRWLSSKPSPRSSGRRGVSRPFRSQTRPDPHQLRRCREGQPSGLRPHAGGLRQRRQLPRCRAQVQPVDRPESGRPIQFAEDRPLSRVSEYDKMREIQEAGFVYKTARRQWERYDTENPGGNLVDAKRVAADLARERDGLGR